jgi:hypothetical protein
MAIAPHKLLEPSFVLATVTAKLSGKPLLTLSPRRMISTTSCGICLQHCRPKAALIVRAREIGQNEEYRKKNRTLNSSNSIVIAANSRCWVDDIRESITIRVN